jgi:predicted nucleotidyltransferase
MNFEEKTNYLTVTGSRLYGYANQDSDFDTI